MKDADGTASALATRAAVGTTATTAKNALYRFDGSKWATPSYSLILQPEDYAEMGQKYGNLSEEPSRDASPHLPCQVSSIRKSTAIGKWWHTNIMVAAPLHIRQTNSSSMKEHGSGNPVANEFTEQFNKIDGNWMFDPSMTITLPA